MTALIFFALACKPVEDDTAQKITGLMSDFSLIDLNIASETYDQLISPRDRLGTVSVWYFGHSNCGICRTQFGLLGHVAQDLPDIPFAGIDAASVAANGDTVAMDDVTSLPWLQDTDSADAWGNWRADWRDVYILDADNHLVDIYNLTDHRLDQQENYDELVAMIEAAR